jgi:16S rRNA (guanine966-N2)-methyltransferase
MRWHRPPQSTHTIVSGADMTAPYPSLYECVMRVVAGTAKGRPLASPAGDATRPTSDRVREALFNALYSLDAVEGARVLDLFGGSGALGIEALSRGAAAATFVESGRPALAAIEHNVGQLGFSDRATVVRADALDWLARSPGKYDLVLCDPPYAFAAWPELLRALEHVVVSGAPNPGVVVLESDREVDVGAAWEVIRTRRYGGTVVAIVRRRQPA